MRLGGTLVLILMMFFESGYAEPLRFSSNFVSQFHTNWEVSSLDTGERKRLVDDTKRSLTLIFLKIPGIVSLSDSGVLAF